MKTVQFLISDRTADALPRLREAAAKARDQAAIQATRAEAELMRRRRELVTPVDDPTEHWLLSVADEAAETTRDAIALFELLASIDTPVLERELQNEPPTDH